MPRLDTDDAGIGTTVKDTTMLASNDASNNNGSEQYRFIGIDAIVDVVGIAGFLMVDG